jgi:LPXTG-site transpeptidase (sortase) family protein
MNRRWRWLEILLLFAGIAALGVWAWSNVKEGVYEDWSNWAFDRQTTGQPVSIVDYLKDHLPGHSHEPASASNATKTPEPAGPTPTNLQSDAEEAPRTSNNALVGRLEIPRLHLRAVVREGTGDKTLDIALGHISGTALPGQNGNVAVAGHRDRLFRGLKDITTGDQIVFQTLHAKFVYQVEGTQIVKPSHVAVLNAGLYPELTLVTCYPFNYIGSAPNRFIVKARQVEQIPADQPVPELAENEPAGDGPAVTTPNVAAPPAAPAAANVVNSAPVPPRTTGTVSFDISRHHNQQLTKSIAIGFTGTNPGDRSADGWIWVKPERRTIWMRNLHVHQRLIFYAESDRRRCELILTNVSANSARGYLVTGPSPFAAVRTSSTMRASSSGAGFPGEQ